MNPLRNAIILLTFVCTLIGYPPLNAAGADTANPAIVENGDRAALELLNQFMAALQITDEEKRIKAILPLVHKSLLNSAGDDLNGTTKDYSYRKAARNIGLYQTPAKVTRVATGRNGTAGFGETAEKGRTDRYFVAKRDGVDGVPAPLHVFFPKDGGKPKILDMGSL